MEFSPFQLGVDVATSLAIFASAITFIWNQRRGVQAAKRRQLDESVRSVTVDEFQNILGILSDVYVRQVVAESRVLDNAVNHGVSGLEGRLQRDADLALKLLDAVEKTREAVFRFYESIHVHKYQVYPLLDSIDGGDEQLIKFKERLHELFHSYNKIGRSYRSLLAQVKELTQFCAENPFEQVDVKLLRSKVSSIITDGNYREWVDSFIPEGQADIYWECLRLNSFDTQPELRKQVSANVVKHVYEASSLMEAQVLELAHTQIIHTRQQCKEFLVSMAAISYWLIRKSGDKETLDGVIAKYRSDAFFAVDNEIR